MPYTKEEIEFKALLADSRREMRRKRIIMERLTAISQKMNEIVKKWDADSMADINK